MSSPPLPALASLGLLLCSTSTFADRPPEILDDTTLRWRGKTLHAIDDEGVFLATAGGGDEAWPLPKPNRPLDTIIERRGFAPPVTCRLIDFVNCAEAGTHAFTDDGQSRVLDLPGGRFRVTAAPRGFDLKWFAYIINTADRAGQPHLLVVETPNDRERYTTVSLTVPGGEPWSPPYAGQEKVKTNAMEISQEPLWYEPDVGLNVYTGRDLPLDGKPFLLHYLFYPKTKRLKLTVSSSGWAKPITEETGGAVSRIWVFEILDPLRERLPVIEPPAGGRQRRVGVYTTHPWYFLAHYGIPPHTTGQRRRSLENLCDTLAFCGMNLIEFNAINGSDRAGRAWYPGSYYKQLGADLLAELPPVAAKRGIDLVPVVTSVTAPGKINGNRANQYGFSEMSFQKHADPKADPRAFENRPPDPLRPETQAWLIRHLVEIAQGCKNHRNVIGIGFRVNGKIGTCYISGEDKSGPETRVFSAEEVGYSTWNLSQFSRETRLRVPADSMAAYKWLKADAERWDKWLDFRCRRTRAFWLKARDAIRKIRPDWTLYVLCDLPAEVLATNVLWPGPDAPDAENVTRDLLRAHGYDPRLYNRDDGIIIQRVMMVDMERYWSKWGPPWGSNPTRYRDFHEQDFLAGWYRTPAGAATELYHTYWEEPFHPDGEFGPDGKGFGMRTGTATARGRAFHRPATFSLRAANCDTIVLTGWERPILGHEHDLRRFCQAIRALPVAGSRPLPTAPAKPRIIAARYTNRIGVINDTPKPERVTVTLDQPIRQGRQLRDVATGFVLIDATAARREAFAIEMEGYDVRTLVIEPATDP